MDCTGLDSKTLQNSFLNYIDFLNFELKLWYLQEAP